MVVLTSDRDNFRRHLKCVTQYSDPSTETARLEKITREVLQLLHGLKIKVATGRLHEPSFRIGSSAENNQSGSKITETCARKHQFRCKEYVYSKTECYS